MNAFDTLLKKGWRSDALWTSRMFYRAPFKHFIVRADANALLQSQFWRKDTLRALQLERIKNIIRKSSTIPFWKDVFARSGIEPKSVRDFKDFSKLPVVSRIDCNDKPFTYITNQKTNAVLAREGFEDYTSGSTGRPLYFWVDRHYELRSFAVCERMFRAACRGRRYPLVSMRARTKLGFSIQTHLFFVRCFNSVKHRIRALREFTEQFRDGFILYGFPSYFLELARLSKELGVKIRPRAVITTGERLLASQRAYIRDALECDVFTCYATRELGWLAFECEYLNLHLNSEWAFVEIVDKQNNSLQDGEEGRIIVTTFDNEIMPFIRYDTGDLGSITSSVCPCGRTLQCIKFTGREMEIITLGNGRTVSAMDLTTAFNNYTHTVHQFQIIQTDLETFLIKVVPGPAFQKYREKLHQKLRRVLHPQVKIDWEIVNTIPAGPNGKAICFKSLLAP